MLIYWAIAKQAIASAKLLHEVHVTAVPGQPGRHFSYTKRFQMMRAKEAAGKREEDLAFASVSGIPGAKAYRNIYIPLGGGRTPEIDVLVLSAKGVFAIEVKGFSGAITGSAVRYEWTQIRKKKRGGGIEKLKFYNPMRQSDAHLQAISRYLRIPLACCHGLVVFSDRATLKKVPPGVLAQPGPQVGFLHLEEIAERHLHGAARGGDELVFPGLSLFRRREPAFALVHLVAELVPAPELREPGAVLGKLYAHFQPPFGLM